MKVKVFLERKNQEQDVELEDGANIADVVKKVGVLPTEVIAVKNGSVVTDDSLVTDNDSIRLLSVISGG